MEDLESALLDVQDAFLGQITSQLRAIVIDCREGVYYGNVYYDGAVDKDQIEWWKGAISEGGLSFDWCECEVVRLDYPQEIPLKGRFAYLRKENGSPKYKGKALLLDAYVDGYAIAGAMLTVQSALIGIVTPNLKKVVVAVDQETKHFYLRLYYDGEISSDIRALWEKAMTEASAALPFKHTFDGKILKEEEPFPEKARIAYARKEINP